MALTVGAALAFKSPPNERPHLGRIIATAAASTGDGGSLNLAEVADFPWDRLSVIGAYATSEGIEQELGFDWKPMPPGVHTVLGDLFLLPSDELTLLVFVRGEREVTGWTILNREFPGEAYVNFEFAEGEPTVFARGDAVFVVRDITGTLFDPTYPGWLLTR